MRLVSTNPASEKTLIPTFSTLTGPNTLTGHRPNFREKRFGESCRVGWFGKKENLILRMKIL